MPARNFPLTPAEAWQPLPSSAWDESAARHLLQRLGWSASVAATQQALRAGPVATVRQSFARMPELAKPELVTALEARVPEFEERFRAGDEGSRRRARREAREQSLEALADLILQWLSQAARPDHAAAEKWLLFLQDVWVVGAEKTRNAALIYQHQDRLRRAALGSYRELAKAMSRSPAMIVYLDLQQSKAGAPNENFARELFELFTLGEGHYTEADIKEAARAFTGYRQRRGEFVFAARQHDRGLKTVFGQRGRFSGDDVIDLVFRQPAAATFLPREMARFYLTDRPIEEAYWRPLGDWWAQQDFKLAALLERFFTSRLFYAPEFRDNFIKSPLQYYLGLVQDLELEPAPLPRRVLQPLRQMGQLPFNPPNVRGWVGGRTWVNSATLATRRAVVETLLSPLPVDLLNADERAALGKTGRDRPFTLPNERLDQWAARDSAEIAPELIALALPARRGDREFIARVAAFHAEMRVELPARAAVRAVLATLLSSPDYHLC